MQFGAPVPRTPPVSRRRVRNVYQHPSLLQHEGPSPGTVSEARALTPTRALYAQTQSSARRNEARNAQAQKRHQDRRGRQGARSGARSVPSEEPARPWTSSPRGARSRELSDYVQWIAHEMDAASSSDLTYDDAPGPEASTASSQLYEEELRSLQLTDLSDSISRQDSFDDERADEDGESAAYGRAQVPGHDGGEDEETEDAESSARRDLSNLRRRGLAGEDDTRMMRLIGTVNESTEMLDLSGNSLHSAPALPARLCILSLRGNALQSLRDLEHLCCLEELDASENQLTSLEGLFLCAGSLRTLNVRANNLRRVSGLETMAALQHLDLSQNKVARLSDLRGLSCNINLIELRLAENPVAALPTFRQLMMDMNPSVRILNDSLVSSSPQVGGQAPKEWTYGGLYASRKATRKALTRHAASPKASAVSGTATAQSGRSRASSSMQTSRAPPGARTKPAAAHGLRTRDGTRAAGGPPRARSSGKKAAPAASSGGGRNAGAPSGGKGAGPSHTRDPRKSAMPNPAGVKQQAARRSAPETKKRSDQRKGAAKSLTGHGDSRQEHALSSSRLDSIGRNQNRHEDQDKGDVAFDDFLQETDARRVIERMRSAHRARSSPYQPRALAGASPVSSLEQVREPREVRGANRAESKASLLEADSARRGLHGWRSPGTSDSLLDEHERFYERHDEDYEKEDDVTLRIQQLLAKKRANLQSLTEALRQNRDEQFD